MDYLENETQNLVEEIRALRAQAATDFDGIRQVLARLGASVEGGQAIFGFWVPELAQIPADRFVLEILTAMTSFDLRSPAQEVMFTRTRLPMLADDEFLWGVYAGIPAGTRDQIGAFYWVRYQDDDGNWRTIVDPLACSIPYGVFAPAELYDMPRLQAERADTSHFPVMDAEPEADGIPRVQAPANILQIHVRTASAEATIAGLTRIYSDISNKLRSGQSPTPDEQNYIGYDAIQLMPIEPIIEYEAGPRFWEVVAEDGDTVTANLRRPDMTNWGYDVMITSSPAVNPALLGTGRPDELVDLIATLHNFPGKPIKVIFDVVYGHIDNQALPLLNDRWFAGANMYGQNLKFTDPVVRAMLLEMQRRKHDLGVDGVRVDGAQDFKNWDPETDIMVHDDDYLQLMNDVVQTVGGQQYRPWMIFEDGRPWPRDDWELASSYREVTGRLPNVWQWGPLTFAHNTPFLFTFWISKWWRIREMAAFGSHWITGCANHDTLRRGTQVDPEARVNSYLGRTLPEVFKNGYDNPAAKLFDYAMMPGIPMDFINAAMRAPWSFVRNTDDRYGVKVMAEEAYFLDWAVPEDRYNDSRFFVRLKALGFTTREQMRHYARALANSVSTTDYDPEAMVKILDAVTPELAAKPFSVARLKEIARAWMDDVHDYCNVSHYAAELDPERVSFNLTVREFRRERPWLINDLGTGEYFDYLHPTSGSVLFFGLRRAPHSRKPGTNEQILFLANMEGAPVTVTPIDLPIPGLPRMGWELALAAPGMNLLHGVTEAITLHDSQGVVFVRQ